MVTSAFAQRMLSGRHLRACGGMDGGDRTDNGEDAFDTL